MADYATHLVGQSFGRLGTVITNPPPIRIRGFATNRKGIKHGLDRATNRSMTSFDRLHTMRNPIVVFEQQGGRVYGFLGERGFVAITRDGMIVTVYGQSDFDDTIRDVLREARS